MLVWHDLRPLQAMAAALFFKHRRLMLVLPRQYGGKTELSCRLAIDLISRRSTKSALFLAKDKKSAKRATREKFSRLCDRKLFEVNTEQIYLKKHRTSILFIESVDKDPDRMRGGTMAGVFWSEVAFSKIENQETIITVFDKVVQPTLVLQDGYALLETTLNGKGQFYDLWEAHKDYGFHRLRVGLDTMLDLGLITREEYDKAEKTTHPDVFRQEYLCHFVTFAGRAYPEYKEEVHLDYDMPDPETWQRIVFAVDWGYHPSATCILFGYVRDGILNVFDEHFQFQEMPIDSAAAVDRVARKYGCMMAGVADHDPSRIEELTRRGIPCANADKTNTLGARTSIKEALYFNQIKIHPRCVALRRDLESAVWDGKKDGEIDYDNCPSGHYDGEAALRYLLRALGEAEADKPDDTPMAAYDTASMVAQSMLR